MARVLLACILLLGIYFPGQGYAGRGSRMVCIGDSAGGRAASQPAAGWLEAALLGPHAFEAGCLRLLDGRQLAVPGLRYYAAQSLVEVQDSVQPARTHFWPLSSLRGFDVAPTPRPAAELIASKGPTDPLGPRRFRTRLVRARHQLAHREAVEILTATEAGPLVLAVLPGRTSAENQLLVGAGNDLKAPLRPLKLVQAAVLRLCGQRARQVRAYAMTYDLHFHQATEVARMLDYFNHLAVVAE